MELIDVQSGLSQRYLCFRMPYHHRSALDFAGCTGTYRHSSAISLLYVHPAVCGIPSQKHHQIISAVITDDENRVKGL